ncbi:LysR family transcriptional regulator [Bradyrhizobium sp. 157]|uniref:LysR family transcriptional regulator n=1 Tax=Bradyrhizobium sp. 157 TaxID=2782631 RepID=UPI003207CB25
MLGAIGVSIEFADPKNGSALPYLERRGWIACSVIHEIGGITTRNCLNVLHDPGATQHKDNGVDHMDETNFAGLPVGGRRLTIVFSRLQHAVAAADYGSFRQAAHALSIKQSTLSRSVQLLEHSIGVVIFERSSGGVRATPAGRHFLRMTRSILEQIEALIASTRAKGSGEAGRLVIGFCTSLTAGNLRATITRFQEAIPAGRTRYRREI